jgi:hypothetical protein
MNSVRIGGTGILRRGVPAVAVMALVSAVSYRLGGLYIADGAAVRRVSQSDNLTTPAGTGVDGPAENGGPATKADFNTCGVAVDGSGNLVIADDVHLRIAVVAAGTGSFYGQSMTAGHIYSVAGDGKRGMSGSGVVATQVPLSAPRDVAVDGDGNLVIADSGYKHGATRPGSRLQVVAASTGVFYGRAMAAGDIFTVAGDSTGGLSGDGGGHQSRPIGPRRRGRGRNGQPAVRRQRQRPGADGDRLTVVPV